MNAALLWLCALVMLVFLGLSIAEYEQAAADCRDRGGEMVKVRGRLVCAKVEVLP